MKKTVRIVSLVCLLLFSTGLVHGLWMGNLRIEELTLVPRNHLGNYGTAKFFINESSAQTINVVVRVEVYAPGYSSSQLDVEVYSNLNRRDHAKVFESASSAGGATSYYMTYPMTYSGMNGSNMVFTRTLTISKCGAYRLTTRFRLSGGAWQWHNDYDYYSVAQRDCAIVVSPTKARDLSVYEVNSLVVEAQPTTYPGQDPFVRRSTFEDFTDHDTDGYDPFNLNYVRNTLGFNTMWLMPIFPITAYKWDSSSSQYVANDSPGSPYATRDFWSVNGMLSAANNETSAKTEFQYMMMQAESLGLNVFIDVAFNHSGRDTIMGQGAVDLGFCSAGQRTSKVLALKPAWATSGANYRNHASSSNDAARYAPADRCGEHVWDDAGLDWYFGSYSSMGAKPGFFSDPLGSPMDERDLYYTDLNPAGGYDYEVERVWKYFAYVLPYWLAETGNRLDGIRADFAQGLPSRLWEYIINKTRTVKWDFIFLAEVLDPNEVLYRINRSFDVITTVDHWLYRKDDLTMTEIKNSLESETSIYGDNAVIMHNGTSHDETGNSNKWLMVARYAIAAGMYGTPMAYMGQPLGVGSKIDFRTSWQNMKSYWDAADPAVYAMYKRLNDARANNPALRSTHRYFLNRKYGGGVNNQIFACARWDQINAVTTKNIVLVFVNMRDWVVGGETYAIPHDVGLVHAANVKYQAYNIASSTPGTPLWSSARSADDIINNGVYVGFSYPNEVQYIKLVAEVTPILKPIIWYPWWYKKPVFRIVK